MAGPVKRHEPNFALAQRVRWRGKMAQLLGELLGCLPVGRAT